MYDLEALCAATRPQQVQVQWIYIVLDPHFLFCKPIEIGLSPNPTADQLHRLPKGDVLEQKQKNND